MSETPVLNLGDVNCDGKITVSDAILMSRIAANDTTADVSSQGKRNGDCNQDNAWNSLDVTLILKYVAGLISKF